EAAAEPTDWTMAAIVGAAGLKPTITAIKQGKVVALANKESLVCGGTLLMNLVKAHNATLLPVDSEHSAIFQVFEEEHPKAIEKIILTASGGPFRKWTAENMALVTPEQAVAHPNWSMGAKISVDSASMMNKGLELIEAHHLFGMPEQQIDIVVHPQSIIHSLVSYVDGSVLAQLGSPDMRTPIAYALSWPTRLSTPVKRLNLIEVSSMTFEAPDLKRFPCLSLARQVTRIGEGASTALNAANEVAVQYFLARKIGFLSIPVIIEKTLDQMSNLNVKNFDDIFDIDRIARIKATEIASRKILNQKN
nr:1-deoxy-D-xylulose-5-phosphate reductoisomerase [Alphaproteobacteria bacterium]